MITLTESIFLFGREAVDASGEHFSQSAVVFAADGTAARDLLIGVLDSIGETSDVFAEGVDWQLEEIDLDAPKLISLVSTRWPAIEGVP